MKLTDQDRARVAEIEARCDAVQGLWGSVGNLAGFAERARVDIPWLLSLIRRLTQEPEVVRCGECKNSSRIASDLTGRMRHCWNGRGRNNGDGFSRVHQDDYCDEGKRKEGT